MGKVACPQALLSLTVSDKQTVVLYYMERSQPTIKLVRNGISLIVGTLTNYLFTVCRKNLMPNWRQRSKTWKMKEVD